jgi:3-oxoacyl-[acyl-carrier-protein] synthase III
MPGFGGGLTYCAHAVRWGARVKPLAACDVELPPNDATALELIRAVLARKNRPVPGATPGTDR